MANQNHLLVAGLVGAIVVAGGLMVLVGGGGNNAAPDGGSPADTATPAGTPTPGPATNGTATPVISGNQTPSIVDDPIPGSLDATATAIEDGQIRVTFNNAHPDAEEYVLRRGRQGYGSSVIDRFSIDNRTEYTFTDAETNSGTTYYYIVVPRADGANVASPSDRALATADASLPEVVSNGSLLTVQNQSQKRITSEFRTSEELRALTVTLDGPVSMELTRSDFQQTNQSGTYRYRTNFTVPDNGTYSGELASITDLRGNERRPGLTDEFTVDNTPPEILSYNVTEDAPQRMAVTIRASEKLDNITVEADATATSTETVVIPREEFTEVSNNGTYTYRTTQRVPTFDIYIVTLRQAADGIGNQFEGVFGAEVDLRR